MKGYDVDAILRQLGKWGRYQWCNYICLCLPWMTAAWHMMVMAFYDNTPPHKCVLDDTFKWTALEQNVSEGACAVHIGGLEIPCGGNGTRLEFDASYESNVVTEFGLACISDRRHLGSLAQSIYMFGYLTGALLSPVFCDKFGRRPCILVESWLMIPISLAIVGAPGYVMYVFLRFLLGTLFASYTLASWSLACEIFPPESRNYAPIGTFFGWVLGYVSLGILAKMIPCWRMLQLAISLPLVVHVVFYWFVRESLFWLNSGGHYRRLEVEIAYAAKVNKRVVNLEKCALVHERTSPQQSMRESFTQMLTTPVLVIYTIVMCLAWFTDSLVYYGLSIFSTDMSSDRFMSFCLSGLIEVPSYAAGLLLMKIVGRRLTTILCQSLAGLALMLLAVLTMGDVAKLAVFLLGKFAVAAAFMLLFAYSAEIFPTTVRTVGLGMCSFAARAGAVVAPYMKTLEDVDKRCQPLLYACMSFTIAILCVCLPETRGETLPDFPDDVALSSVVKAFCWKTPSSATACECDDMIRHGRKPGEQLLDVELNVLNPPLVN